MNLTKQPIYQKGSKKKDSKAPTAEDRRRWSKIVELGCIVGPVNCMGRMTIHHTGTGAGGRKDHKKALGLCENHHLGVLGINGGHISRREWEIMFGTEEVLLHKTERLLGEGS